MFKSKTWTQIRASNHNGNTKKNNTCLLIQLVDHDNPIQAQNELCSFEGAAHQKKA